jgi:hypothetical protein
MRFPPAVFVLFAFALLVAPAVDAADALTRLDTNQNHLLEEAEAQAGGRKLFSGLDKSGDGFLQPEELNGRLGAAVLKAADPDADGALNPQEYAALITARYKSASTSPDGLVDVSELNSLSGRLLLVMILP